LLSQVGFSDLLLLQVENMNKFNFSLVWSWPCCARQLGAKAPSPPRARRGPPFHRALRSLLVRETWLLGPVSPRMHASRATEIAKCFTRCKSALH
jgi:hypothetical protein